MCFLGSPLPAVPPLFLHILLFPNAHSLGLLKGGGMSSDSLNVSPLAILGREFQQNWGGVGFMMLVSGVWKLWLNC